MLKEQEIIDIVNNNIFGTIKKVNTIVEGIEIFGNEGYGKAYYMKFDLKNNKFTIRHRGIQRVFKPITKDNIIKEMEGFELTKYY